MAHYHKYNRQKLGDKYIMKCCEPNCSHYMFGNSKLSFPLLKGMIAKCSRCLEPFILNRRALRMAVPCCDSCVKRKNKEIVKSAEAFFSDLERSLNK